MKVIFMGTPEFSVGTLEALIEAGHEIVLAVTQPDKPKGRGKEMQFPPVKECALSHGIPVFQPKKIREPECIEELKKYDADVCVVIAFGQILPKEILQMTPFGCINVHASLLPKYRGAAPIQWAVINGEEVSGVTTMQMDEGLDTGDMLEKTEIVLDAKETGGSLHDKLAAAGACLCVSTLEKLANHELTPEKQGESTTEYARMLDKKLGRIDWNRPACEIERLIRGLNPWPSAYTDWEGKTMKIWEADVVHEDSDKKPGTVVEVTKNGFAVQTGKGLLQVKSLQIPGKKRMEADAFLRGYPLSAGMLLG
ncbi:methionyl-tRNA formyltransferase [Bariatricus massiliensis]|uniref:Methionyl-tRNA formyltransferase n=1 Tax=Bariatricus massiliensis TaxID=1745713 RepID=A0ABS8DE35_9FIRM|nr:methionyl-tRNA formyltransferase [Bariatricus massiliensis]MCB7302782.1 methionyl-tRNA formyltransferase [Bariatricus massiliensis]MCB7373998.1 methionyl-tRNA formyltransferase [Bariatricus massiliensis]MCB7386668.1 methionyl-tRNA formyltransferase [Bariatricus massiliensis]MCB7410830.1 methionyl-tRNA formyltransferase [Bariatricus massiliensis]MCQ5251654.1 methionyl-tRNA formyltransferase [Bariatricus massiliensis]